MTGRTEQPDALDPAVRAVLEEAAREPWEATTSDYQPPGYPSAIVQHEAGGRRTDVVAPNVRSLSDAAAIVYAVNTWAAREERIAALERADRANIVRLQEMVEEQDALKARLATLEAKFADATRYCSGDWPCEASTEAAALEAANTRLEAQLGQARAVIDAAHALDAEIYCCTAPLSVSRDVERFTRRLHNALVEAARTSQAPAPSRPDPEAE